MRDTNWMEFTGYLNGKILVNKQKVCQVVPYGNKNLHTEIILDTGKSVLVREDYEEVKKRLETVQICFDDGLVTGGLIAQEDADD